MAQFKYKQAFSSFSVVDLRKAKQFYSKASGIDVSETNEGLTLELSAGKEVFVYPKENHAPASFTVLNFLVDNVDQSVDDLSKKGVHFEIYK